MSRPAIFIKDVEFLTRHNLPHQLAYAINASVKFNYIYFETPKAACSTIKRFLIKNECSEIELFDDDGLTYAEFNYLHQRDFSPLLSPRQLYPFRKHLESGQFFKFCFVRNPYERLLSAYLDKIVWNRDSSRQIKQVMGLPPGTPAHIPFADFVHAVCSIPIALMDGHWKVQYYHACMDQIKYDLVGKVETFAVDIERVCDRTGLDMRHLKRFAPHVTNSASQTQAYYTPELRDLVYEKYRSDFEALGYSR